MPRYRKADEELKCNCGHCHTCSCREWNRKHPEKSAEYTRRWLNKHPEKRRKRRQAIAEYYNAKRNEETCAILKKHAEELKDDPERLSTEFMQRLIGIKCKKGVE